MKLEDRHLDVLQNIEFAIVSIYRGAPGLKDTDVIKALEALISHYQRRNMGQKPAELELPEDSEAFFNAVKEVLELRSGPEEMEEAAETSQRRRSFSRALRKTTKEDIYLACLRKIHKSAKRWNQERGERGYLDFVSNYVL